MRGYWPPPQWACSSVVEHCVDIAGVASSILATPTIENPVKSTVWRGFCLPGEAASTFRAQEIFGQILGISAPLLANSGHEIAGRTLRISDSLALCRHGLAKPHDASSSNCGRVFTTVAREPHFAAAKRCCAAAKQAISSASKKRHVASAPHRARDPPKQTQAALKSRDTLCQPGMATAVQAPQCARCSQTWCAPRSGTRIVSLLRRREITCKWKRSHALNPSPWEERHLLYSRFGLAWRQAYRGPGVQPARTQAGMGAFSPRLPDRP